MPDTKTTIGCQRCGALCDECGGGPGTPKGVGSLLLACEDDFHRGITGSLCAPCAAKAWEHKGSGQAWIITDKGTHLEAVRPGCEQPCFMALRSDYRSEDHVRRGLEAQISDHIEDEQWKAVAMCREALVFADDNHKVIRDALRALDRCWPALQQQEKADAV